MTQVAELLKRLDLREDEVPGLDPDPQDFRLRVPPGLVELMTPGDPSDPLLNQVLPRRIEQCSTPGYAKDPVGDTAASLGDGLLQKYSGRALLMVTGACAAHCRYCFRRHYPYADLVGASGRWATAIARIARDASLTEVILSGGDPLMLDDASLGWIMGRIETIPHLQRLRIHSRLPVILPSRVTDALCRMLAGTRLQTSIVVHVNHPQELGESAETALMRLRATGITLLNQGVLLRAINDDTNVLTRLSERLFECGVLPYYLHQLDPVAGAAHFQVGDARARGLAQTLRERLPGYLVPRLVREQPGAGSKMCMDGG